MDRAGPTRSSTRSVCSASEPNRAGSPFLQLIGTPTYEGRCLKSLAAEFGVEDSVIVLGEVPHRKALEAMKGSDIQLLVGFSGQGSEFQSTGQAVRVPGRWPADPRAGTQARRHLLTSLKQGGVPSEVCDPGQSPGRRRGDHPIGIREVAACPPAGTPSETERIVVSTAESRCPRLAQLLDESLPGDHGQIKPQASRPSVNRPGTERSRAIGSPETEGTTTAGVVDLGTGTK